MAYFSFTRTSGNSKTGPISTSMTTSDSCPDACGLKGQGCYARFGMTGLHWRKLDQKAEQGQAMDLEAFTGALLALPKGAPFRHNVAGDLPDADTLDAIAAAAQARRLQGWTYTHNHAPEDMRSSIAQANASPGLTVNLSADSPAHADELAAMRIGPVVTVVSPDAWHDGKQIAETPSGNLMVRCPAEYVESMNCAACMLCAVSTRKGIVAFTAHGSGKNKAAAMVKGWAPADTATKVLEDTSRRIIPITAA